MKAIEPEYKTYVEDAAWKRYATDNLVTEDLPALPPPDSLSGLPNKIDEPCCTWSFDEATSFCRLIFILAILMFAANAEEVVTHGFIVDLATAQEAFLVAYLCFRAAILGSHLESPKRPNIIMGGVLPNSKVAAHLSELQNTTVERYSAVIFNTGQPSHCHS